MSANVLAYRAQSDTSKSYVKKLEAIVFACISVLHKYSSVVLLAIIVAEKISSWMINRPDLCLRFEILTIFSGFSRKDPYLQKRIYCFVDFVPFPF